MSDAAATPQQLATLALHAGQVADSATNSRAVPIYQTNSYLFNDSDHAAGQAAETLVIQTLASAGEEIVSTTSLYGGTYNLFHYTLPRMGITVRFADADDLDGIRAAITPKTRANYTETLGNPKLDIADIEKLAAIAHENGLPLVIDN